MIFLVIFICAVLQSVFGVGLLIFGTPTLLLMGYSFSETLSMVLPASICISGFQVFESHKIDKEYLKLFVLGSLPWVIIFLGVVLFADFSINLKIPVGIVLILSGILRISPTASEQLKHLLIKHKHIYLFITGTVHGLTNIGGGLITLYVSTQYRGDKKKIREILGLTYLILSILQFSMVALKSPELLTTKILIIMAIAILSYQIIGRALFHKVNALVFDKVLTGLILTYGILMLIK